MFQIKMKNLFLALLTIVIAALPPTAQAKGTCQPISIQVTISPVDLGWAGTFEFSQHPQSLLPLQPDFDLFVHHTAGIEPRRCGGWLQLRFGESGG